MVTGWFTDTDGNEYYLWPESDGTKGHMTVGWQWIDRIRTGQGNATILTLYLMGQRES